MAAADAYNFDEAVNRTRHESALGLPPSDKLFQRMELAGRLVRRHEEDPSLDEDALCKETREAVGLRKVGPVNTVFKSLVVGKKEFGAEFAYNPVGNTIDRENTPGRTPRTKTSPGAPARARKAIKRSSWLGINAMGWRSLTDWLRRRAGNRSGTKTPCYCGS